MIPLGKISFENKGVENDGDEKKGLEGRELCDVVTEVLKAI